MDTDFFPEGRKNASKLRSQRGEGKKLSPQIEGHTEDFVGFCPIWELFKYKFVNSALFFASEGGKKKNSLKMVKRGGGEVLTLRGGNFPPFLLCPCVVIILHSTWAVVLTECACRGGAAVAGVEKDTALRLN